MVAARILDEDEPLELLEGRLVVVTPQGHPHMPVIMRLTGLLTEAYGRRLWQVAVQGPLVVRSAPEPALAVVRGGPRAFDERLPRADEAVLVIEVAVTSYRDDVRKRAIYARAGVRAYWLVDVPRRRIEVLEQPDPSGRFLRSTIRGVGEMIAPPGLDLRIRVDDVL